jgi:Splicing factor 3B subunit 10 (SF3b10)
LTKWEWATHQHRDTLSSIVGHPTLASYLAVADGESIGRIKFEMAEVRMFLRNNVTRYIDEMCSPENATAMWTAASETRLVVVYP